ncbi:hypothetical protein HMPREF9144_1779 [Prevotella pallens ATCC 700821]|uniref:Uncharacterized protein n=1 Tax=Prevotella pallens ATCC 700821 TaxID=997353 RepID=F9DJD8_9BACT|nr:hypothetical protein HMPREF9144_1779 [Prevotella pallens ATCC 700821]
MIYKILKVHSRNSVGIYAPEVVKALISMYRQQTSHCIECCYNDI